MGRQYGFLLRDDLNQIYNNMSQNVGKSEAPSRDRLLAFGNSSFQLYPQRYKEIILGMAETSGLGLDDLLIINCLQIYLLSAQAAQLWLPGAITLPMDHWSLGGTTTGATRCAST
jgi:hypothetical protein